MKKLICVISMVFALYPAYSQWITGLNVYPAMPDATDNIQVIVGAMFSSGGCYDWYIPSQMQNGSEYTYYLVNCVGMLTYICSHNDTITMGSLPPGNYSVIVNLNEGSGDKPCTPFSQWVSDTVYFIVSPVVGISMIGNDLHAKITLDPETNILTIELPETKSETLVSLYDLQGQLILQQPLLHSIEKICTGKFTAGVYIVKVSNRNGIAVKKFVKE
ncbi:MAG TPA: T9SS type A sorting domain-containing protein [Bacteroidales bacterium]|nr:T9SS type A sorting domain-containing protein [Bacteroidales bacterium]